MTEPLDAGSPGRPDDLDDPSRCRTCNGYVWTPSGGWVRRRETVGLVCPTCGTDYSEAPND